MVDINQNLFLNAFREISKKRFEEWERINKDEIVEKSKTKDGSRKRRQSIFERQAGHLEENFTEHTSDATPQALKSNKKSIVNDRDSKKSINSICANKDIAWQNNRKHSISDKLKAKNKIEKKFDSTDEMECHEKNQKLVATSNLPSESSDALTPFGDVKKITKMIRHGGTVEITEETKTVTVQTTVKRYVKVIGNSDQSIEADNSDEENSKNSKNKLKKKQENDFTLFTDDDGCSTITPKKRTKHQAISGSIVLSTPKNTGKTYTFTKETIEKELLANVPENQRDDIDTSNLRNICIKQNETLEIIPGIATPKKGQLAIMNTPHKADFMAQLCGSAKKPALARVKKI